MKIIITTLLLFACLHIEAQVQVTQMANRAVRMIAAPTTQAGTIDTTFVITEDKTIKLEDGTTITEKVPVDAYEVRIKYEIVNVRESVKSKRAELSAQVAKVQAQLTLLEEERAAIVRQLKQLKNIDQ